MAMMTKRFATIGDDGRRPVVWGIGHTPTEANLEAARGLRDAGTTSDLTLVEIDEGRYQRILDGDVDAHDLCPVAVTP